MAELDYECDNGHLFQAARGRDREKCPECGLRSPIIWLSPRSPHRQFKTPIVLWKYSDGSLGVAGGADSVTPRAAERIEIRSGAEYQRYANLLNSQHRRVEQEREDRFVHIREHMEKERRSRLTHLMGQESDPLAKDFYREALERDNHRESPRFQEFFSAVMENDRSNYD